MVGQKSMTFGPSARRLVARMRPERGKALTVLLLAVVSVALTVVGPRILGHATDLIFTGLFGRRLEGTSKADAVAGLRAQGDDRLADMLSRMDVVPGQGVDFGAVGQVLLLVLAVYVAASLLSWLQGFILNDVVQSTVRRMRGEVEDKINRLPLSYFDRQPRGELLSRVTNDIDNVSQTLQQTMSQLLVSLLTVVGVLAMMVAISPTLALVALVTVPLSMLLTGQIMKRSQGLFIAQWRQTGALNAHIEETFTGHALVKVFGRQAEAEDVFGRQNDELFDASFGAQFVSGLIMPVMMFIGNVNYVVIAVLGGLRVASGSMSLGDVQAFIQYSRQFTQPLTQVASMVNLLQSGVASAERVFELLDAEEEPPEQAATPTEGGRGEVVFEHVSFRYDPDQPLIDDLSLVAPARPDGRDRRSDRSRQDHAGQPGDALLRPGRRPDHPRRRRHRHDAPWRPARPHRDGAAGHLAVRGHRSATTSPTAGRTPARRRSSRRPGRPSSTASCTTCPTATTPSSTRRAAASAPASGSWSRSRARSWPTLRC